MSKKKPRGKTPSLIGGANGRPRLADVKRRSSCYRCRDVIPSGSTCIEIPELGGAYASARRVCNECFALILDQTQSDLDAVRALIEKTG